jgi:hypothetical protein
MLRQMSDLPFLPVAEPCFLPCSLLRHFLHQSGKFNFVQESHSLRGSTALLVQLHLKIQRQIFFFFTIFRAISYHTLRSACMQTVKWRLHRCSREFVAHCSGDFYYVHSETYGGRIKVGARVSLCLYPWRKWRIAEGNFVIFEAGESNCLSRTK